MQIHYKNDTIEVSTTNPLDAKALNSDQFQRVNDLVAKLDNPNLKAIHRPKIQGDIRKLLKAAPTLEAQIGNNAAKIASTLSKYLVYGHMNAYQGLSVNVTDLMSEFNIESFSIPSKEALPKEEREPSVTIEEILEIEDNPIWEID
ncbi:MAG: hypothetical protein SP1CHLAM54_18190 [Chlamydiia bacterium]|nr:hypothetical protein [Chlamydiia bacterium]